MAVLFFVDPGCAAPAAPDHGRHYGRTLRPTGHPRRPACLVARSRGRSDPDPLHRPAVASRGQLDWGDATVADPATAALGCHSWRPSTPRRCLAPPSPRSTFAARAA